MRLLKLLGISALIFTACSTPQSITQTSKLDQGKSISNQGLIYSLPQTHFRIRVTAKEKVIKAGPFAAYAKKQLGIKDAPKSSKTVWKIEDVKVFNYQESDPSKYYVLEPGTNYSNRLLKIQQEGLIMAINQASNIIPEPYQSPDLEISSPAFTDLSVNPFEGTKKDTIFKRVLKDSVFVRVPILKSQFKVKSLADKAEEAAHQIFKLRKRRFLLITGKYDKIPDGEAMQASIDELARQEEEYLSLFIGKTFERTVVREFDFFPSEENQSQASVLFRFIPEHGVLSANDMRGRPVFLTMKKENKTDALKNLNFKPSDPKDKTTEIPFIEYRVPDMVKVKINYGTEVLFETRKSVYQYGEIIRVPINYL